MKMNHKSAHTLRCIADKVNHEYGAKEVENSWILIKLEECSMHGQLGCGFVGAISGYAIRYLEYLGYEVKRKEGNGSFYVSFKNALQNIE